MEFFKPGRRFDFMSQRKFWISLSLFIVFGAIVTLFVPGLNYGTDFRGGTEVEVGLLKTVNVLELRKAVESVGFHAPDVVQVRDFNNPNHFLIRVSRRNASSNVGCHS